MQLQNEKLLKDYKTEILDAIQTSSKALETSLGTRIDKVESSLNSKIDKLDTSLNAKISGVETSQAKISEDNKQSLSDQIKDLK